jgi:Family of unknown function (DUF6353)
MNFDQFTKVVKNNSPSIISAAAVAGVITTAVLTHRAALKASKVLAEAEEAQAQDGFEPLVRQDKVRLTWRIYAPTAASGIATIGCIVWANQLGMKRQAALVAAYALADTAFREYKDQVVQTLGEKQHDKIRDAVAEKRIQENPPPGPTVVLTGGGEQLCYDSYTGRYFRCDMETIRQAVNLLNAAIINGNMHAALNEFYSLLGMDSVSVGEVVGWNLDNLCDVGFSSHMAEDGRVALAITFTNLPKADYGKCF